MKIAIQGHPTRGEEVIQTLENLGGKNDSSFKGINKDLWYFINSDGNIRNDYQNVLIHAGFKTYTLEEFEKEFPFKIGDKVFLGEDNVYLYTIKSISIWDDGDIVYELVENELHYTADKLTLYKEMKEERNITLTLDKAKEWYKKGGELKEIALQAFSEEELNPLPRSWKEFCENYPIQDHEAFINFDGKINVCGNCVGSKSIVWKRNSIRDGYVAPSQKSAEAHLAMIQLEQLRDCWRQGWEPIWDSSHKSCIRLYKNELEIGITITVPRFLTFPTYGMAEEFLKCFRSLIETARDLI